MQLSGQPGDHHAVSLIGLARRIVLLLAGDVADQRLHAHQPQPRSAHSRCTRSHRGPAGSHATVTDVNPFTLACPAAQSTASPSRNASTRTVLRASTRTS